VKPRTLWHILRIEGLIPFTGCAILIGFVVCLWEKGITQVNWGLFAVAVVAASMIHIDAHVWNDIMDVEIDKREKSRETGRERPLVYGWATVGEYRTMSAIITITVVLLAAYLTFYRFFIPVLFVIGFFFDYGYNHPRIALGHHPFTEWYIFPWLVVGVTVTIVYAATNIFSPLAFLLALLHGMTVTCFGVSMMRRDAPSDRAGGKCTSSVKYPTLPHSTIYGISTMLVTFLLIYPLALVLGSLELAYLLALTTTAIAAINTVLGAKIDQLCTRTLYSVLPDFEARANKLMLQQVGASMVHATIMIAVLLVFGGIL
jgi:1,4-dihydroxy-2-naphthoate octaprenyltransferase